MKWLLPLTFRESSRLYWELGRKGAPSVGKKYPWKYGKEAEERLMALALLQCRFDPRLAAILVDYFQKPLTINPLLFKQILRETAGLPILAALSEFVLASRPPPQVGEFFEFLTTGVKPVPTQLFYRGLYKIGGVKMREATEKPLQPFIKWGFLAADPPFLKEFKPSWRIHLFDRPTRLRILRELSLNRRHFSLKDYLGTIHFSVSRQQALKDLSFVKEIGQTGSGKGTRYKKLLVKRP